MLNFKKIWVRVVLSLFAGGILTELLFMHSNQQSQEHSTDYKSLSTLIIEIGRASCRERVSSPV